MSAGRHRAATVSDHTNPTSPDPSDEPAPKHVSRELATRVVPDRAPRGRWRPTRRLTPIGVCAAALLAAGLLVTLLQPGATEPALGAALIDRAQTASPDGAVWNRIVGDGGPGSPAARGVSDASRAAQALNERERADRSTPSSSEQRPSDRNRAGSTEDTRATGPVATAAQVAGDGVQAALSLGWGRADGDEFNGSSLARKWTAYDGPGHAGNGRRTPDAVSVQNGNLVIRGDSQGNTGGIAWGDSKKYGKWEMRARFPHGDAQYHPVLLLWPSEMSWPQGGEVDFAETNSAADDVSFFLHHGSGNAQETSKRSLDLSQWHNYGVEWTPRGITGYVDGVQWFRSTDPDTLPPGPMHPTIQLDYFPDGGSPKPSELQVAWMRQYG